MKGIAKVITNLKPTAGGAAIAQLPVGGWVYGEVGATDLSGFSHYYKPGGERMDLGQTCKAWKANLTLVDEAEPTPEDDPPVEDPPSLTDFDIIRQVREGVPTGDGVTWGAWKYEGVKVLDSLP